MLGFWRVVEGRGEGVEGLEEGVGGVGLAGEPEEELAPAADVGGQVGEVEGDAKSGEVWLGLRVGVESFDAEFRHGWVSLGWRGRRRGFRVVFWVELVGERALGAT